MVGSPNALLDALFLGPKSEQREFFKNTLNLILDDYLFWRRNFHPKDPPSILLQTLQSRDAVQFRENLIQQLFNLVSDLKVDVPFFSPRYMGHIVSEVSLPGLFAYIATLLYNPNNVSSEASPVTMRYELEVGRQLASLCGFDPQKCFGHITSGGTIANYEAVWYGLAAKFLPVTMVMVARQQCITLSFEKKTAWQLLNVPSAELEQLWSEFVQVTSAADLDATRLIQGDSIFFHGYEAFRSKLQQVFNESLGAFVILAPKSVHYSWQRAAEIFGLGSKNLIAIDVDGSFHARPEHYETVLAQCEHQNAAIVLTVAVAGTTEFGTVDRIDCICDVRDRFIKRGVFSRIHVDAAFGGYFATMFRDSKGAAVASPEIIPPHVECAFKAISRCDSVTIDPHKMAYVPYGAGALVLKEGFLKDTIAISAPYSLGDGEWSGESDMHLGKYIMEGSKPGAAASAVWFTHQMLPLHCEGLGSQLLALCTITREFHDKIIDLSRTGREFGNHFEFKPLLDPETNVLAFYAIHDECKSIKDLNGLNLYLFEKYRAREVESVQSYQYVISHTIISLTESVMDAHSFLRHLNGKEGEVLVVLRLVIMNRWVCGKNSRNQDYRDGFINDLSELVRQFYLNRKGLNKVP
jgi:glutamate/tyrosine decarboxylase-like PLP-dependent enzyme